MHSILIAGVRSRRMSFLFTTQRMGIFLALLLPSLLSSAYALDENDAPTTGNAVPVIQSGSYPNEEAWYNTKSASFYWDLPQTITAVRTLYDTQPDTLPSKVYDPPIASKSFMVDDDGVFYLHVQFKGLQGWGEAVTRKFQIDTHAPRDLSVSPLDGDSTTDPNPTFLITATDELSGVDRIDIAIDNAPPVEYPVSVSNMYSLKNVSTGKHTVAVRVMDKAGNAIETTLPLTIEKLDVPRITDYTRHIEKGNKIVVSGVTYPDQTVQVVFIDEDKNTWVEKAKAGTDGVFSLVFSEKLPAGVYDMRARVMGEKGSTSEYTDMRTIVVEDTRLIRTGSFIINWLSAVLITILLGALVAATLWYAIIHFLRFRRKIVRTMKEAEIALKANVAALRRDTEEFHTILVKAEKKRELTKEEQSILKKFKKRLDVTEKEIEKKLEKIG